MLKKYFTRYNLFLVLIILTGVILRVYKIQSNYYFSGELGKELLYIREYVINKSFPLVGMATSHPWLYYGPAYYWFMIPIFNFFNGNPFILFWSSLVISVFGLVINYIVVKKLINNNVAIVTTMIEAVSPLLIWQTRLSKLHVFFWVLMPIFTYLLSLIWNGNKKYIFIAGFVFGILFSFHFSQIPLFGVIGLLFWIKKDVYKFLDWIKFFLGVLVPNLTLVWQDRNLALWLPYRIVNAIEKKHIETISSLNEYFGKTILWDSHYWFIGFIIFVILFSHYVYKNRNRLTRDFLPFYLTSSIGLMLMANVLHGSPPVHYFLPIFTTLPILLAIYLTKFRFWAPIIILVTIINLYSFINDPIFYKNYNQKVKGTDIVSYSAQNNVVTFVLSDAKGKPISIKRVGMFDYFPEEYSQNYKYLILWRGGILGKDKTNLYTIIESDNEINVQK